MQGAGPGVGNTSNGSPTEKLNVGALMLFGPYTGHGEVEEAWFGGWRESDRKGNIDPADGLLDG
jgi:hypothetical protein